MANNRMKVVILGEGQFPLCTIFHRRAIQCVRMPRPSAGRVGKTSILLRFVRGEYSDKQQSTLQASYLDKRVSVSGQQINLSIWDTAGQERFHALGPIYYRDAGQPTNLFFTWGPAVCLFFCFLREFMPIVFPSHPYRNATPDGAMLVYDITDFESFTKVQKWIKELRSIVSTDIPIVICGNKFDREKERAVKEADALS